MKQENLGMGLVFFLIHAFFGFATEPFEAHTPRQSPREARS